MVDPKALDSEADDSILTDSGADELGVKGPAVDDSAVDDSEVSDPETAGSEAVDSKANDSTVADSEVDELVAKGPTVDHSAVESSIVDDSAVDDSEVSGPEMVDSDADVFILPDSKVDEVGTEKPAVDNSSCADSEVAEDSSSLSVLEVSSVVDSRGWVVTEKINVDVEVPSDVMFDDSKGCTVGHLTPVDVFAGSGDVKDSRSVKAVVDSGAFLVVETLDISDDVEARGDAEVVEDPFSVCKLRDSDASSVEDSTLSFAVGELCSGRRNELRALCVALEIVVSSASVEDPALDVSGSAVDGVVGALLFCVEELYNLVCPEVIGSSGSSEEVHGRMESDVLPLSDADDTSGAAVEVNVEASSVESETVSDCACSKDVLKVC